MLTVGVGLAWPARAGTPSDGRGPGPRKTARVSAAAPRNRCQISGPQANIEPVRVMPAGAPGFELAVRGLPVEATPPRSVGPVAVTVGGVLRFSGVADHVPFRVARRTKAAWGILNLSTDTDVLAVHAAGTGLRVDLSLDWGGVRIHDVQLPCDALAVGYNLTPDEPRTTEVDGTAWEPVGDSLVFHATPGSPRRVQVELHDQVSFGRIEARGGWYHLHLEGADRSVLQGWVRRDQVRPGDHTFHGGARDYGGIAGCGRGHAKGPNLRFGPASLTPGAWVYAKPGVGAWATVASGAPVVAMQLVGDPWTRLVSVEGLSEQTPCAPLTHAWILSSAVRFQEDPPASTPRPRPKTGTPASTPAR